MKSIISVPPHIPSCKIRGRLIPLYGLLPRLKKLCFSLGFHDLAVTKSGETTAKLADRLAAGTRDLHQGNGQDHLIVLSARLAYDQDWGAYSGLPGQFRVASGKGASVTPSDYILPYLRQYRFAQDHIHLGFDSAGRAVATMPDALVSGQFIAGGVGLQINIAGIAEPEATGQRAPSSTGTLVTFLLSARFKQILDEKNFFWHQGAFSPIGDHLTPELFTFTGEPGQTDSSPFPELAGIMPWIVSHKTPHLAATLIHLQTGFAGVCETFMATGTGDQRNLLCVAGLEIDMKGFRGRKEHYFVPWQACWKRHGYCYGNIYPLLQDDLFVALMNFNRIGSGAEYSSIEQP